MVGQTSGAIAIVAEKLTSTQISFIHKNDALFKEGEVIVAQESLVEGIIVTLDSPSHNITENFKFTDGQGSTFLDYGTIIRNENSEAPEKKIKIYFAWRWSFSRIIVRLLHFKSIAYCKSIWND